MFKSIKMAPSDPILGIADLYNSDTRTNKINLGIGVYVDKFGNIPVLTSVKRAEEWLLQNERSKNYLSIEGAYNFNNSTQSLLFGENDAIISKKRIRTIQTPGGTGALRVAAEFIAKNTQSKRVWISAPGWTNHKNIFLSAGLEISYYPYYNFTTHSFDFENLIKSLKNTQTGDVVLLHGCCHNPTGTDPNSDQWNALAELSKEKKWLPLFDLAYQGFAYNLTKDLTGLHIFCKNNKEIIICNSYSKNFGLYNERVGSCTIIAKNHNEAECAFSQLRSVARANYSNPPAHGALIVAYILNNKELRYIWENELEKMREHIQRIRRLLLNTLQANSTLDKDFSFIAQQNGMFCFMGLDDSQVLKLREESGIYLVGSGRINLSGLSENKIEFVSNSILELYNKKNYEFSNI